MFKCFNKNGYHVQQIIDLEYGSREVIISTIRTGKRLKHYLDFNYADIDENINFLDEMTDKLLGEIENKK